MVIVKTCIRYYYLYEFHRLAHQGPSHRGGGIQKGCQSIRCDGKPYNAGMNINVVNEQP